MRSCSCSWQRVHKNAIQVSLATPHEFLITQQQQHLLQLANMMNEDDTTNMLHRETTHTHIVSVSSGCILQAFSTFSQFSLSLSVPRFQVILFLLLMPTEKLNAHTKVTQKIYLAGISFTLVYHTQADTLSFSFSISLALSLPVTKKWKACAFSADSGI